MVKDNSDKVPNVPESAPHMPLALRHALWQHPRHDRVPRACR